MSTQAQWAQALLDPEHSSPTGITTWNHSDPARRLAVYRNNVVVSLVDALAQTFPVTLQLVGEAFFRAMAQVFVRHHPPRTRVLSHYGQGLPTFVAQFPPVASLPYLADVARLEWMRLQALHAGDTPGLTALALTSLMSDVHALPTLHWQLSPSLHLLRAPHAAVSLWAAHQPGAGVVLETVDVGQPESALVFRSGLDVMVLQVNEGLATFVAGLMSEASFGTAIENASQENADFDLAAALAMLVRHALLTGSSADAPRADFPTPTTQRRPP